LKRRLREVLRTEVLPAMPAVDLILRAAPLAYELPFESIREEVGAALRRLPSLKPE
jgi:RNase P protein component